MTEKELKPGIKIKKIGSTGPIWIIDSLDEFNDFIQYRLIADKKIDEPFNSTNMKWVGKSEILRDYEILENEEVSTDENTTSLSEQIKNSIPPEKEYTTTIEQSNYLLEELGLSPKTCDCYWILGNNYSYLSKGQSEILNSIPAWTAKALMKLLPKKLRLNDEDFTIDVNYTVGYKNEFEEYKIINDDKSLVSALILTLKDVLDNETPIFQIGNLITPKEKRKSEYERYQGHILKIEDNHCSQLPLS